MQFLLHVSPITFSNNDAESQKQELQRVYEWFRLNKPLLRPQKKPCTEQRPRLAFTSRSSTSLASVDKPISPERPQTAPASFHQVYIQERF